MVTDKGVIQADVVILGLGVRPNSKLAEEAGIAIGAGGAIQVNSATIKSRTRSGYFPGSGRFTVKLTADANTGRLLGGQIVGMPGSGKRIDTLAMAVMAELTAIDLAFADLSYAPPFSPVWDPVQTAARQLLK